MKEIKVVAHVKRMGNGESQLVITDSEPALSIEKVEEISHVVIKTKKINLKVKVS